jgi:hypothetical protein
LIIAEQVVLVDACDWTCLALKVERGPFLFAAVTVNFECG